MSMDVSMTLRWGEAEEGDLSAICWITAFQHCTWYEECKCAVGLRRERCDSLSGQRTWEPLVDYSAGYRIIPLI